VQPNAAHHALADLAGHWDGDFLLVTQNVDDLHDRAHAATPPASGFELIHMHGELLKAHCTATGRVCNWPGDLAPNQPSPHHPQGRLRPHIVWFGEMPLHMDRIEAALARCDLFVSIAGARTVEINLEPTPSRFDEGLYGPATEVVPTFTATLLA
jgi:NAD-dependent deacetylase